MQCINSIVDSGFKPLFTGKERDTESGNDYMFARYYNSATGRFLSPDWSAKGDDPVPYANLGNRRRGSATRTQQKSSKIVLQGRPIFSIVYRLA